MLREIMLIRRYYYLLRVLLVMLLLSGPFMISAQPGAADPPPDTSTTYLSPMEYAFMMHEEPKFMLRLPVLGLGAEVMLFPGLTFMGQFDLLTTTSRYPHTGISGEFRYYPRRRNTLSNHMSGNYIALGGFSSVGFTTMYYGTSSIDFTVSNAFLKIGAQRRVFGKGLVDLSVNFAYEESTRFEAMHSNAARKYFNISTEAFIGLGLVFSSRKDMDWSRMCPVTRCYDAEKWMVKVNTAGFFHAVKDLKNGIWHIHLNPKIAVEHKLFKSAFSLNTGLTHSSFYAFGLKSYGQPDGLQLAQNDLYGELRYYYNLKQRMLTGKTGNGLSANYFTLGYLYRAAARSTRDPRMSPIVARHYPMVATGIQRTLGKRFYFDVKLGCLIDVERIVQYERQYSRSTFQEVFGDLQVGFKF